MPCQPEPAADFERLFREERAAGQGRCQRLLRESSAAGKNAALLGNGFLELSQKYDQLLERFELGLDATRELHRKYTRSLAANRRLREARDLDRAEIARLRREPPADEPFYRAKVAELRDLYRSTMPGLAASKKPAAPDFGSFANLANQELGVQKERKKAKEREKGGREEGWGSFARATQKNFRAARLRPETAEKARALRGEIDDLSERIAELRRLSHKSPIN